MGDAMIVRNLFVVLFLVCSVPMAHAACDARIMSRFQWGDPGNGAMSVGSGESCAINVRALGTSQISGVKIARAPKNGTATVGGTGAVYRSKAGFKGSDSFSFAITGKGDRSQGTSTIEVSVTVN